MTSDPKNDSTDPSCTDQKELTSYKFLLGDFGIGILAAIYRGARSEESIMMLSGVPMACVKGRMPVLMNLQLVSKISMKEYAITKKGADFLRCINECI